ncbi:hypothetical protein GCM10007874_51110 [Labrys miyagiensis]|uniref:Uncharacterized protein n=1 Tax=Labrys miyagiensis TaxID=346912 RepID=A0ABQ6CTN7_9HYPH|nr:hypothetical protein GCM10007874_51110 [Labrys miyagiensis]
MGDGANRTTGGITGLRFDETLSPIPRGPDFEGKIIGTKRVVFAGHKNDITSIRGATNLSAPAFWIFGRLTVTAMDLSS